MSVISNGTFLYRPIGLSPDRITDIVSELVQRQINQQAAQCVSLHAVDALYDCLSMEIGRYRDKTFILEKRPNEQNYAVLIIVNDRGEITELIKVINPQRASIAIRFDDSILSEDVRVQLILTRPSRFPDLSLTTHEWLRDNTQSYEVFNDQLEDWLRHCMRMLKDPSVFVDRYVSLLEIDEALKFEHKRKWNEIVVGL